MSSTQRGAFGDTALSSSRVRAAYKPGTWRTSATATPRVLESFRTSSRLEVGTDFCFT